MKKTTLKLILCIVLLLPVLIGCKDEFKMPYRTYSSLISQSGENAPSETVLLNELGITITWIRISVGMYRGILSKPVDLKKSTLVIQLQDEQKIPTSRFFDSVTINLDCWDKYNVYDAADGISNAVVEIKQYN